MSHADDVESGYYRPLRSMATHRVYARTDESPHCQYHGLMEYTRSGWRCTSSTRNERGFAVYCEERARSGPSEVEAWEEPDDGIRLEDLNERA